MSFRETTSPSRFHTVSLHDGWLFGGETGPSALQREHDESSFVPVTLPHSNAEFSWKDIDRSRYEYVSVYRRHLDVQRPPSNTRVFVDFDGSMGASTVAINGAVLGEYKGGYTPFSFELTHHLDDGDNVLAVEVDSRSSRFDVPPLGGSIDFDTFGGIYRDVLLRTVPDVFVSEVFAKPVDVLTPDRRLDVTCFLDATVTHENLELEVELTDGATTVATQRVAVAPGSSQVTVVLPGLAETTLWDVDNPVLYEVSVRLIHGGETVHVQSTRTGFREAVFTTEGFFLNGRRLQLFGLNRHQLFPYTGNAMPARVQRRDAEILRNELNCNIVRTSHYVQSPHFLDACDELGLLVWDEMPGWHHIPSLEWQDTAAEHVEKMIRRDRNRPSVILWGVRVNETRNEAPEFEDRLQALAHQLDDSRQTTGAYAGEYEWDRPTRQDVRGQNDYSFPDVHVPFRPPNGEHPYLISEAVGQKRPGSKAVFDNYYRRIDAVESQQQQARRHADAQNLGASDPRYTGVVAWCAFDYNSPRNSKRDIKTPGVCDLFRIPKLAALFYQSQCDPSTKTVIEPAFYWDFGPQSPNGPGAEAMVCSNCERLEIYLDDKHVSTARPDRGSFPHLQWPPYLLDLTVADGTMPELRIDGYVGDDCVLSRRFSGDRSADQLVVVADDDEIVADGIDATRVVFRVVDRHGAPRPFVEGSADVMVSAPGYLVGDSEFDLEAAGGVGAVWVRSEAGSVGDVRVSVQHPIGKDETVIRVVAPK
jgi:beta-galactosidase